MTPGGSTPYVGGRIPLQYKPSFLDLCQSKSNTNPSDFAETDKSARQFLQSDLAFDTLG